MSTNKCNAVNAKEFCTCPVEKCPRHPKNHNGGCDPCILDNLKRGKMPACFYRVVSDDVSEVRDFTIQGFVDFFNQHEEEYKNKFSQ